MSKQDFSLRLESFLGTAPATSTSILLVVGLTTVLCLHRLLSVPRLPMEPPYVSPRVPWFGHALSVLWRKAGYYSDVAARHADLPIFTLPFPGTKTYVITSPELVLAAQKHPKAISFWVLETIFGARMGGLSKDGMDKLMQNPQGERGESLSMDIVRGIAETMKPGAALDAMNRRMLGSLEEIMNEFAQGIAGGTQTADLWDLVQHVLTCATTDGAYGPANPYRDPETAQAYWDVSDNATALLMGLYPSIFARKAHLARAKIGERFQAYYNTHQQDDASAMAQGRFDLCRRYGLSVPDIAISEVVTTFTILSNTVPTGFWALWHVLADPALLRRVRDEAEQHLLRVEPDGRRVLSVARIRESPVLSALLSETLRHHALGASTRVVTEDVLLDGKYLIKKDALVTIPNRTLHFSPQAWGAGAGAFDPGRFETGPGPAGAMRGFGGGANMCTGRFFAATEILSFVAMVALRFDVVPVVGGRQADAWASPGMDTSSMAVFAYPPRGPVKVEIRPRAGWEGGQWSFELNGS